MPLDFTGFFGAGALGSAGGSCGGGPDDGDVSGIVPARAPLPAGNVVYGFASCPYCMRTKGWLSGRGIPYTWRDVEEDPAADAEAQAISGQQGVPVVVLNDQVIVGFELPAFETALRGGR